jgi:hypothetical protein
LGREVGVEEAYHAANWDQMSGQDMLLTVLFECYYHSYTAYCFLACLEICGIRINGKDEQVVDILAMGYPKIGHNSIVW